jgi:hypothetical protein
MNGTVNFQTFTIIRNNPNLDNNSIVTQNDLNECCFILPALAEIGTPTSELKNDKHSVIYFFDNGYTDAEFKLQKYSNGSYSDIATLNNNDYGTFYDLGFYETIYAESAIGYLLDFNLVINDFGIGNYRIKCNATLIDTTIKNYYSFEFCLKEYSDYNADNTVRLDWNKNGNSGSLTDDTRKVDYGVLNWFNSIRIPNSYFGKLKPTKTKKTTKYQTGQVVRLSDSDEIEYSLICDRLPLWLVKFINFDANYNSEMYVTDYNSINFETYNKKQITSKTSFNNLSDYDVDVTLIDVEWTYEPAYNNFKHNYE